MEFNAHKPIYLQICSQLYEQILRGELKADDRILSVRDYGIQLGVNPNTTLLPGLLAHKPAGEKAGEEVGSGMMYIGILRSLLSWMT